MNLMRSWIVALLCLVWTGSCSSSGIAGADSVEFVHLRVIDNATGEPAVGAQVYYLDKSKFDPRVWSALGLAVLSPNEIRDAFCDSVVTDSAGNARIPWSRDITAVEARQGSMSGTAEFDPAMNATVLVRLVPDHVKRIKVVDPSGNPVAGVPILLVGIHRPPPPAPNSEHAKELSSIWEQHAVEGAVDTSLLWFGRSLAPDGVVEVSDWREIEKRAGVPARIRCCPLPDLLNVSHRVDIRSDDQPTVLTVPVPGLVVVNVRCADGTPAPRNTIVMLASAPIHAEPRAEKSGGHHNEEGGGFENRVVENGQAIFPAVWVGRMLHVSARSWDGSRGVEADIEGPRVGGSTVVIDLALGERLPTLTGRLVDEHGAPMPWTSFDIRWKGDKPDVGLDMDDAITDGTGRFRLDLDENPAVTAGEKPELEIKVQAIVEAAGFVEAATEDLKVFANHASTAHVSLTKPLTPGDIDLGDIVLRQSKE